MDICTRGSVCLENFSCVWGLFDFFELGFRFLNGETNKESGFVKDVIVGLWIRRDG